MQAHTFLWTRSELSKQTSCSSAKEGAMYAYIPHCLFNKPLCRMIHISLHHEAENCSCINKKNKHIFWLERDCVTFSK